MGLVPQYFYKDVGHGGGVLALCVRSDGVELHELLDHFNAFRDFMFLFSLATKLSTVYGTVLFQLLICGKHR
jgi:hypothetical protein